MASENYEKNLFRMKVHMERVLGNLFEPSSLRGPSEPMWRPATDVYETEGAMVVVLELAGVDKREIRVVHEPGFLRVSGVRRDLRDEAKTRQHRMEIDFGPFERIVELPSSADGARAQARYENGFLFITIPKGDDLPAAEGPPR